MKKKIFALALCVMLVICSMLPSVYAEDANVITVKNAGYDVETGLLTFTLANTSMEDIADSLTMLVFDDGSKVFITLHHFRSRKWIKKLTQSGYVEEDEEC